MLKRLLNLTKSHSQIKINFNDLTHKRIMEKDTWNNLESGQITMNYFYKNNEIGFISYRIKTGQIGLFFINNEYQHMGLGKQILSNVIKEMKERDVSYVWAVTCKNHYFWSNVYNKGFEYKERVHSSVTGDGYIMKI